MKQIYKQYLTIMVYYGTINNILPMKNIFKLVLQLYILCWPQSCNAHDRQSDTHKSLTQWHTQTIDRPIISLCDFLKRIFLLTLQQLIWNWNRWWRFWWFWTRWRWRATPSWTNRYVTNWYYLLWDRTNYFRRTLWKSAESDDPEYIENFCNLLYEVIK